MALRVLLLRKKLTDQQTALRALEQAAEGFSAREAELAADIEAAQTEGGTHRSGGGCHRL